MNAILSLIDANRISIKGGTNLETGEILQDEWHFDLDLESMKYKPRLIESEMKNTIYLRKMIYEWYNP